MKADVERASTPRRPNRASRSLATRPTEICMPKGMTSADARISDLKKMSGTDFAMRVGADMLLLQPTERERALRTLTALHETLAKEAQANGAKV